MTKPDGWCVHPQVAKNLQRFLADCKRLPDWDALERIFGAEAIRRRAIRESELSEKQLAAYRAAGWVVFWTIPHGCWATELPGFLN